MHVIIALLGIHFKSANKDIGKYYIVIFHQMKCPLTF